MSHDTIVCAGIDTGKHKLDAAIGRGAGELQVANTPEGHAALSAWLRQHQVERVGIEATGGYEHVAVAKLRSDGFTVIVFQPGQVRAYARFKLKRAKTDRIDAALIAACATARDEQDIHPPPDPRIAPFAEQLTMIEQIAEDIARVKTRRENVRDTAIRQLWADEIKRLRQLKTARFKELVAAIRLHDDLAEKLDLIASVDSIALPSAVAVLVRMPEIGTISRERAAALAGLAPYPDDSGNHTGVRHIEGGRQRLRKTLYNAAFAGAFRWNQQLRALYKRLIENGKGHKRALIACARKLLIFANAVVARSTPWTTKTDNA